MAPIVGSQPSGIRLTTVLMALKRLGASIDVLAHHGWAEQCAAVPMLGAAATSYWREEMVYRMVSLLAAFAQ